MKKKKKKRTNKANTWGKKERKKKIWGGRLSLITYPVPWHQSIRCHRKY